MSNKTIKLFQQYFSNFARVENERAVLSNNELNQMYQYAMTNGSLISKRVIIIDPAGSTASDFINLLSRHLTKQFTDLYVFKIDMYKLLENNSVNLIEEFKNYLTHANILVIEDIDLIVKSPGAGEQIAEVLNKLHPESYLIATASSESIIERMNLKNSNTQLISLKENAREPAGNAFGGFASFIKDIKDEAGVREELDEKDLRGKYIEKLYVWEMKNFNVDRLKKIINHPDISRIEKEFEDFTAKVRNLVKLHKEYGLLNTQHFKEDGEEIESMLFNPDSCKLIEKKIDELKDKITYFRQFRRGIRLHMTLDSFIADSTNRSAYNKINEIIKNENTDNLVILTGAAGTGKTHLLNAILNAMMEKKVIMLNEDNIDFALKDDYILQFMYQMDMILFDNFDDIYRKVENKPLLKKIAMNKIYKVMTMHRKYSIEDTELIEFLNSYPAYNIQPPSLYIEKSVIREFLDEYGIEHNETILNYILDNSSIPLSKVGENIKKLKEISGGSLPTIDQIHQVFPKREQKKPSARKPGFDTSNLIKEWINQHDRLYVEFRD